MANLKQLQPKDWEQFEPLETEAFEDDKIDKGGYLKKCKKEGFFGLFNQDTLIGYLYLTEYGGYGHLNRIAVHKDYRGEGYGKQLMSEAIEWFEEKPIDEVGIYVETDNEVAVGLYQAFDFQIRYESWHYIIDMQHFNENIAPEVVNTATLRQLTMEEVGYIDEKFPLVETEQIRNQFKEQQKKEEPSLLFLGMFEDTQDESSKESQGNREESNEQDELKLFSRFSPSYSGSMPFVFDDITYVDQFLLKIQSFMEPEKEIIRLTFDNYENLANLLSERGYTLHHHMYKLYRKM